MRTDPDDLAADVAELGQHWAAACQRCTDLDALLKAAMSVRDRLAKLRTSLSAMLDIRRDLDGLMASAVQHQREIDSIEF